MRKVIRSQQLTAEQICWCCAFAPKSVILWCSSANNIHVYLFLATASALGLNALWPTEEVSAALSRQGLP
jgi:hypothetical protein